MNNRQMWGLGACVILAIGVFMPIFSIPFAGTINYFLNGQGDGVLILILAGISALLVMAGYFRALFITGVMSILLCIYTISNFMRNVAGDSFSSAMIRVEFGWVILFLGGGLLIFTALKGNNEIASGN